MHPLEHVMKRRYVLLVVLIVVLALVGGVASTVKEPDVDVESVTYQSVKYRTVGMKLVPEALVLKVRVRVDNPNWFSVHLRSTYGSVYYNGEYTGEFYRTVDVDIKASGTTVMNVSFDAERLPKEFTNPAEVRVVGRAVASLGPLEIKAHFDKTEIVYIT